MAVSYDQSNLDFETKNEYEFAVEVTDGQLKSTAIVKVVVKDCNEAPSLVVDNVRRYIEEETPGRVQGAVQFSDLDSSDLVTYEIISGVGKELFSIDNAGNIETNTPLNHEERSVYYLTIMVTDDPTTTVSSIGQSVSSSSRTYRIDIDNINEEPSLDEKTSVPVTESSNRGDYLLLLEADDEDFGSAEGDDITFSFVSHDYNTDGCPSQNKNGFCCETKEPLFEIIKADTGSTVMFKR